MRADQAGDRESPELSATSEPLDPTSYLEFGQPAPVPEAELRGLIRYEEVHETSRFTVAFPSTLEVF